MREWNDPEERPADGNWLLYMIGLILFLQIILIIGSHVRLDHVEARLDATPGCPAYAAPRDQWHKAGAR